VRLDAATAEGVLKRLLWNVELMLDHHCVHGDLSPFNILYRQIPAGGAGQAILIDFPQATDPRLNHAARSLLTRDVEALCAWAGRMGVRAEAGDIAARLWQRFREGWIG
jgi:serine/threonine-protein kinase RIO1